MSIIAKYRQMSFEERTICTSKLSLILNVLLAIAKTLLSIFLHNGFFFLAACVNFLFFLSKLECILGIENKGLPYKKKNLLISIFLFTAGIAYMLYMLRLLIIDEAPYQYHMYLGITIALVSFIELGLAIKGIFNSYGKTRYYRNIKLINLCTSITALVLTEIALTSFAGDSSATEISSIMGLIAGVLIVIIALGIALVSKYSIEERKNVSYSGNYDSNEIEVRLTNSKIFGNYIFIAKKNDTVFDGTIIKEKSPIFKCNLYIKIICCIFSEILIFVYAIWYIVFYINSILRFNKLDDIMSNYKLKRISIKKGL